MENTLQLKHIWALWETYFQDDQSKKHNSSSNYEENISKLVEFKLLQDFANLWTYLPHSKPSVFFLEHGTRLFKKLRVSDVKTKQVASIAFFKSGIQPAWEDPKNAAGGGFSIFMEEGSPDEIDKLWKYLVLDLMGGSLGFEDAINGIRIVERSKPPKNSIKLEIWVNFRDETQKSHLGKVLTDRYIQDKDFITKIKPILDWRDH